MEPASWAMNEFAAGALTAAYLVAALFFLRFWRDTRDRLFGYFAAAFLLFAAQRAALALLEQRELLAVLSYGLRVVGFLLIVVGVVHKNLAGDERRGGPSAER
jgi:hypothetical protein